MHIQIIPANEYRRVRWNNGLGWTREIVRWPEQSQHWDWRLSIAEVDKPGPFSLFDGCERELVLLAGEGMRLNFQDGETVALLPPHSRHRFSGERPLNAELVDGPTQDFNLIWRREKMEATLLHRPLVGAMVFFPEPGVHWAIFVLSGHAAFKDRPQTAALMQYDTALIGVGEGDAHRLILDGAGELLVIKFARK